MDNLTEEQITRNRIVELAVSMSECRADDGNAYENYPAPNNYSQVNEMLQELSRLTKAYTILRNNRLHPMRASQREWWD